MSASWLDRDLALYGPLVGTSTRHAAPISLAAARRYCRDLTRRHYENFTVASWLLPAGLRPHFHSIYAYCRWADDLADEVSDPQKAEQLLDWWRQQLLACRDEPADHPVFIALADTIRQFDVPLEPFLDLLVAMRQDQRQVRYETVADLQRYCRYSANPVGRLVLHLGRAATPENICWSDSICTGLQWANFCQDVGRDFAKGRFYLPAESRAAAGYDDDQLGRDTPAFRRLLAGEVDRAERYLHGGRLLPANLPGRLRLDVELFVRGGFAVLQAIRRDDYNVWARRPVVGRFRKLGLLAAAWLRRPLPQPDSTFAD